MAKKKTAKKTTQKKPAPQKTSDVMDAFELVDIRLIHSESLFGIEPGQTIGKTNLTMNHKHEFLRDEQLLRCRLSASVKSMIVDSNEPAMMVNCTYAATYKGISKKLPSDRTIKEQEGKIASVSIAQAFPYVRHHVHWLTSQMGLRPLTLPMRIADDDTRAMVNIDGKRA